MSLLTIVVPVFNNAADLPQLVTRLRAAATAATLDVQLVCVDDGSADGSYAVLARTIYRHSPDALVLVLASHTYDPADYIRDYEEFIEARMDGRAP